jgi:hypothetical protein
MNWLPFYGNLENLGCQVVLSNPLQTKAIASARIKNDKVNSRILADLLRTNLLPTGYISYEIGDRYLNNFEFYFCFW